MNEGSTGSGDAGHHHWKPVTPVSAMVVGRLVLGLPSAVVDAGARRRAARNPATAGQVAAMIVSSRPCGSLERQARMMSR